MTLLGVVGLLIVATLAGVVGQAVAGYAMGGCLVSAVVGLIGALIGGTLAGAVGLPDLWVVRVGGWGFPVVWATVGAALFSLLIRLVMRRRPPVV